MSNWTLPRSRVRQRSNQYVVLCRAWSAYWHLITVISYSEKTNNTICFGELSISFIRNSIISHYAYDTNKLYLPLAYTSVPRDMIYCWDALMLFQITRIFQIAIELLTALGNCHCYTIVPINDVWLYQLMMHDCSVTPIIIDCIFVRQRGMQREGRIEGGKDGFPYFPLFCCFVDIKTILPSQWPDSGAFAL